MSEQHVVTWYIPRQVVYIGWDTVVTQHDIGTVSDAVTALMNTASGMVTILNDTRRVRQHPQHPLQIRHALTYLDHPRMGTLISVTGNAVMRFLATVVPQMTSFTDNKVYGRMDSALEQLQAQSAHLPLDWAKADNAVFVQPIEAGTVWPQPANSAL